MKTNRKRRNRISVGLLATVMVLGLYGSNVWSSGHTMSRVISWQDIHHSR
jgi:hypothetical protein